MCLLKGVRLLGFYRGGSVYFFRVFVLIRSLSAIIGIFCCFSCRWLVAVVAGFIGRSVLGIVVLVLRRVLVFVCFRFRWRSGYCLRTEDVDRFGVRYFSLFVLVFFFGVYR